MKKSMLFAALSILLGVFNGRISAYEPPQESEIQLQELPGPAQLLIVQHLITDAANAKEAAENLKSFLSTDRFYNSFWNSSEFTRFVLKTFVERFQTDGNPSIPNVFVAAALLGHPKVYRWILLELKYAKQNPDSLNSKLFLQEARATLVSILGALIEGKPVGESASALVSYMLNEVSPDELGAPFEEKREQAPEAGAAAPDARPAEKYTAVAYAILKKNLRILSYLLARGASPNAPVNAVPPLFVLFRTVPHNKEELDIHQGIFNDLLIHQANFNIRYQFQDIFDVIAEARNFLQTLQNEIFPTAGSELSMHNWAKTLQAVLDEEETIIRKRLRRD